MNTRGHAFTLIIQVALVALLARALSARMEAIRPRTGGADVLQIVLGDARHVVSLALLEQVDATFHGGAKPDDCAGMHAHEGGVPGGPDGRHGSDGAHPDEAPRERRDPWSRLNRRIHVQEHRHLDEADFVELLPWVWAACRAAPANIQAYQIGAYVLWRHTGQAAPAVRLLEEGLAANPGNAELAFALGEYHLNRLDQPAAGEAWFRQAAAFNPADRLPDDAARLLRLRTLHYLGFLAHRRGDGEALRSLLAEARALQPGHAAVQALEAFLSTPAKANDEHGR